MNLLEWKSKIYNLSFYLKKLKKESNKNIKNVEEKYFLILWHLKHENSNREKSRKTKPGNPNIPKSLKYLIILT